VQTNLFRGFAVVLLILIKIQTARCENIAPPLAQVFIEELSSGNNRQAAHLPVNISNDLQSTIAKQRRDISELQLYLSGLKTNWAATVVIPSRTINSAKVAQIQEVFQFYFGGKTNYEEQSLQTLIHPRVPFDLPETALLSKSERQTWNEVDYLLRMRWFQLLRDLQVSNVLTSSDYSMASVNLAAQHLWAFNRNPNLLNSLTPGDFDLIVKDTTSQLELLNDSFLKKMAANVPKQSSASAFEQEDPYILFSGFRDYLDQRFKSLYSIAWQSNRAVFGNKMPALVRWVHGQQDEITAVLKVAGKMKNGSWEIAADLKKVLDSSMLLFENGEIPHVAEAPNVTAANLTEGDLVQIQEFNKYLLAREKIDVNQGSIYAKVLFFLQSEDWRDADSILQTNSASVNLSAPVSILVSYVRSHPSVDLTAEVEQIHARMEGLQDLAVSMISTNRP
jgi:hypothetical protein